MAGTLGMRLTYFLLIQEMTLTVSNLLQTTERCNRVLAT
jgi:hypothetical protein